MQTVTVLRALVSLAVLASAARAGAGDCAISGSARTVEGTPLPQVVLVVQGPAGERTIVTGPQGRYRVAPLAPGEYRV